MHIFRQALGIGFIIMITLRLQPEKKRMTTQRYMLIGIVFILLLCFSGSRRSTKRIRSEIIDFFPTFSVQRDSINNSVSHFSEMGHVTNCSQMSPFFNQSFLLIKDRLSPLWWSSIHAVKEPGRSIDDPFWNGKLLIVIGDSLDRKMLTYVCSLFNGTKAKEEQHREMAHPFVCVTPTITTVYLNIFGMDTACPNRGARMAADPREFNSTAERISTLLPRLITLLPPSSPPTDIIVQIGSNIWDISDGCNNHVGINEQYATRYRGGIHHVYTALREALHSYYPSSKGWILWKMVQPMSLKTSDQHMAWNLGMVRINQEALNTILLNEVGMDAGATTGNVSVVERPLMLGEGIVDIWNHVKVVSLPEDVLQLEFEPDGYHYEKCASLSFFNFLLDVIYQLFDE